MKGEWLRRSKSGAAIVFVHGVLSSGETCWRNVNGTYWPALVEQDAPTSAFDIYVFTYRTDIFSGSYRLSDVVDALKEHMRLDGVFDCHTLIFVAHSMGGLVVRKLLVERVNDFMDKGISIGLFLVASPSLGSRYADMIAPLARLFGHSQANALRFSQDNTWLNDLDKEFMNQKEARILRLHGKELVEDVFIILPRFISKQVVEPFSGFRYFGEPFKVPASDHFSIAKPGSADAIQHRLLLQFISEMPVPIERELRQRLEARLEACSEAEIPFRTYHKLAALFAMRSRFAAKCFDTVGPGTAERIQEWLHQAIQSQVTAEQGQGIPQRLLDHDPLIAKASAIASRERAAEVDERHCLLALLEDRDTGTMREIVKHIGGTGMRLIQTAADTNRPERVRVEVSVVIPLAGKENGP